MSLIDLYNRVEDYLNIKLKSDAFEDGIPYFYKENPNAYYQDISQIHKILYRLDKNKPLSAEIFYEPIHNEDYLDDMVELHKEWFPFSYDRNYFKKYVLRHQKYITVGAFVKIGIKNYLVGFAVGDIVAEEKFRTTLPGVLVERGWYDFITPWVNCCYLHSVGVIDEYRKLSVGTRLLEMFIDEARKKKCVSCYANVIIHNNSGIKFMEGNNWHYFGIEPKYYRFNETIFDAKTFYYVIDKSWCKIIEMSKSGNNNSENGIEELPRKEEKGCMAAIWGLFGYSSDSSSTNKNISNSEINKIGEININGEENKV